MISSRNFLLAASAAALVIAVETPTRALEVNVDGILYDVTTFTGNYNEFPAKFNTPANGGTMPWWGSASLARAFASEVKFQLGIQDISADRGGPLFAIENFPDFSETKVNYYSVDNLNTYFYSPWNSPYVFAEVAPKPPVPGPLPLLGACTAFGVSRRLRRRIQRMH